MADVASPSSPYPLRLEGRLVPGLSRWLWLVKWLLAVPHYVVLALLWLGLVVATASAFVAILVTGRYPRALFDYSVGVLRWTWRVGHYSWSALGTDRYPPFTLADVPDYPARLDLPYPQRLSRGLALVKWWLLALPHYVVVSLLVGGGVWVARRDDPWLGTASSGLIGVLVLVAGVVLAATGRYPQSLYDLVVGLNRWVYRVAAYALLLTDSYPPFRLDLGGSEPQGSLTHGAASAGTGAEQGRGTPASSWSARRVGLLVAGAALVLTSVPVLGAGAAALWADQSRRDADGYVSTGARTVSTTTSAVVAEPLEVALDRPADASWLRRALGTVRVEVQVPAGRESFVGVARADDVDRYLRGAAVDRVVEVRGSDGVSYARRSGEATPAPPGDQPFWAASASGADRLDLDWEVVSGRWALVLMNTDSSPGVRADVGVGATLPGLRAVAAGLLAAGLVLLAGGTVLLVAATEGATRPPTARVPSPRAPAPPAPTAAHSTAPTARGPG